MNRIFIVSDMGTVIEATGVFTSQASANEFMLANEGHGLLHSANGAHFTAKMGDKGFPVHQLARVALLHRIESRVDTAQEMGARLGEGLHLRRQGDRRWNLNGKDTATDAALARTAVRILMGEE